MFGQVLRLEGLRVGGASGPRVKGIGLEFRALGLGLWG